MKFSPHTLPLVLLAFGGTGTFIACSSAPAPTVDPAVDSGTAVDTGTPKTDSGTTDSGPASKCGSTQTSCTTGCADVKRDALNCGACDKACGADELCDTGACKLHCPAHTSVCGSRCADTSTDNANCGACGKTCDAGSVCSNGACKLTCASNLVTCSPGSADAGADAADAAGDAGSNAPYCANTTNDRINCGACGVSCNAGEQCNAGKCELVCGGSTLKCGARCVDPMIDENNCGGCGSADATKVCGQGTSCTQGLCCTPGKNNCNGACIDLTADVTNCGACGTVCGANKPYCINSACSDYHAGLQLAPDFNSGGAGCGDSSKWYTQNFGMMTFDQCEATANSYGAQYMGSANGGYMDSYNAPYANSSRWVGEKDATTGYISSTSWASVATQAKNTQQNCILAYANGTQHGMTSFASSKVSTNGKTYFYKDYGVISEKVCYTNALDASARPLNPDLLGLGAGATHFLESHTCHGSVEYTVGGFQADGAASHNYRCLIGYN